jgi:glycerophosphoryl diester phosphodiesterase
MRFPILYVFALAVAWCGSPVASDIATLRAKLIDAKQGVMVVAHRGCWHEAPENSLAAIEACADLGVDMVEIDVQRSHDNVLFLMHDATVDRMTPAKGAIVDFNSIDLKRLKLKQSQGEAGTTLTDQYVPTLAQALEVARGRVLINIDAKADVYADVAALLQRMGLADQVLMKMPAPPSDPKPRSIPLMRMAHFMPVINEREGYGPLSRVAGGYADLSPVAYEIIFQTLPYFQEGQAALKATGKRIWVNALRPEHAAGFIDHEALNDPDGNWGRLIDMGVSIIQTDEPKTLIRYLQQRELR